MSISKSFARPPTSLGDAIALSLAQREMRQKLDGVLAAQASRKGSVFRNEEMIVFRPRRF